MLASLLLHAAAFLAVRALPPAAPPALPAEEIVEVSLLAPEPIQAEAERHAEAEQVGAALPTPNPHAPRPNEAPRADPSSEPAAPAEAGSGWVFSPFRALPSELNLRAEVPPPHAPQAAPVTPPAGQQSVSGGLREGMLEADAAKGLGRAGRAIGAVDAAAREAPDKGNVLLALTFDATGVAVGADIVHRSSSDPGWDSFARAVLAAAKQKPAVRMPDGMRGVVVTLRVESKMLLPNGGEKGETLTEARRVAAPPCPKSEIIGNPAPCATVGRFDLADLGATPKKRVIARFVREETLR